VTKAKVVTADRVAEVFDILAGVLRGDTLAPYSDQVHHRDNLHLLKS
jgi:hypothetical protein